MLLQTAFSPVSSVLSNRRVSFILTGAVGLQVCLTSLSLPSWECPVLHATGIPCPGCGLSRAMALLLRGDLRGSLRFHAFAPIFLIAFVTLVLAALLPRSIVQPILSKAGQVESNTRLTLIILTGLILYWLARLLFFPASVQLIRG